MITQEEFDRVHILLGRKEKPKRTKHSFTYTGIIRCAECGCMVSADKKTKTLKGSKEKVSYLYYCCTHNHDTPEYSCPERKNIEEKVLEEQIDSILSGIEIISTFKDWAIGILKREHTKESTNNTLLSENLNKTILAERNKINRLTDLFMGGHIDEEEYKRRKQEITENIATMEKERTNLVRRQDDWIELVEKTFHFATRARTCFREGDTDTKRQIFMALGSRFQLQ